MNKLANVTIEMFDRKYDLCYGPGASQGSWLMLKNQRTGNVLPLTPLEGRSTPPREVDLYDVDGIVPALEAAGIVRRIGVSAPSLDLKVARCAILHEELAQQMCRQEMEREHTPTRGDDWSR